MVCRLEVGQGDHLHLQASLAMRHLEPPPGTLRLMVEMRDASVLMVFIKNYQIGHAFLLVGFSPWLADFMPNLAGGDDHRSGPGLTRSRLCPASTVGEKYFSLQEKFSWTPPQVR